MTWLTWRLQRTEFVLLGLMLLGLGGALLLTHGDVVALARAADCAALLSDPAHGCLARPGFLYDLMSQGLPWFNFLPLIAALLLALPIVMELENGTYRLAWTQGVTRGQWARTKLGVLGLSGLAFAASFTFTFHWWSAPLDRVNGRLGEDTYDLHGTLPIGHTLFAIGLMLAVGTVLRRPVPAIALASVAYLGVRLPFMVWVRPRLISPLTTTGSFYDPASVTKDWQLSWEWRDAAGNRLSDEQYFALCAPTWIEGPNSPGDCIARHGLVQTVTYHPPSHYWPLQLIETGIFLAAGLALIGFAAWYMLRRVE